MFSKHVDRIRRGNALPLATGVFVFVGQSQVDALLDDTRFKLIEFWGLRNRFCKEIPSRFINLLDSREVVEEMGEREGEVEKNLDGFAERQERPCIWDF